MAEILVDLEWVYSKETPQFDTLTGDLGPGDYAYANGADGSGGYLVNDPDGDVAGSFKWLLNRQLRHIDLKTQVGSMYFHVFRLPNGRLVRFRIGTGRVGYLLLAIRNAIRPAKAVIWDTVTHTWREP